MTLCNATLLSISTYRHYIKGDCRFTNANRQGCRFSHNLLDPQPRKVLLKFNIDLNQSPQELVNLVRFKRSGGGDEQEGAVGGAVGGSPRGRARSPRGADGGGASYGVVGQLDDDFAKKAVISASPRRLSGGPRSRHLSTSSVDQVCPS